jgi:hypothetical protein
LAAARNNVPAIYSQPYFAREGGLLSYGPDAVDLYRRAASYVDRILRGEKPGDLPVQFPTKFEMVVNRKAATALGLAPPPSILLRVFIQELIAFRQGYRSSVPICQGQSQLLPVISGPPVGTEDEDIHQFNLR